LIESKTYRYVAHNEGDDIVGTYRTQEELDAWKTRCPIELMQSHLKANFDVSNSEIQAMRENISQRVEKSIEFARKSPWPDPSSILDHVLCESK
jgi:2-oxoisovalerate dehydrogenase E1 component